MKVILYDEGIGEEVALKEIVDYLTGMLGEVEVRGSPFAPNLPQDRVSYFARRLAAAKVYDVSKKLPLGQEPLYGEIEFERRRILGKSRSFGVIYDGFHLLRILGEIIPQGERSMKFVHIILTNRLFATWNEGDRRYHLRTSVYSFPSLISTTGLVEAPAKPREYYILKQQYESMGKDLTELKERFKGRYIDYGDKRLTEVARGYALQAVFFALTGSPFCEDRACLLYNAHWQDELIFAQLKSGRLCERHAEFLRQIGAKRKS